MEQRYSTRPVRRARVLQPLVTVYQCGRDCYYLSTTSSTATSWSARSWFAYQIQRISIRLTKAVAWELASELGCAERREGVPAPGQMPGPALID